MLLAFSWIQVSSYSQITQVITRVILNNSSYNSSYSRITRDSDPTFEVNAPTFLRYMYYLASMYVIATKIIVNRKYAK